MPPTPEDTSFVRASPPHFACSPSTFYEAERCPLKFVRDGSTPLPSLPWNVHGTVVHRLIASPPIDADFELAYDRALRQELERASETQSRDPWLAAFSREDVLGRPLLEIPNFAVRRADGIALARRFAGHSGQPSACPAPDQELRETQVSAGSIRASVDLLSEAGGLLIVTDFKTGAIHDPGSPDVAVKPQYQAQLLIYAAMIHLTHARWPDRIRLVSSDGTTHEEPVDRTRAQALLDRCTSLRHETETMLAEGKLAQLALGTANGACETCTRRHRCPAISKALQANGFVKHGAGAAERFDLRGRVVSVAHAEGRSWLDVDVGVNSPLYTRVLDLFRSKPNGVITSLTRDTTIRIFGLRGIHRTDARNQGEIPHSFDALDTTFIDLELDLR
jgi:hypothetical protein